MIGSPLALVGWVAATVALATAVLAGRALADRRQAVAEACHELRGPLTAVALGLEAGTRQGTLSPARLRALELELGRAALALDDLEAQRRRAPSGHGEVVDLRGLLADSVEAWRQGATLRGGRLRLHWSGPDALVAGDRLRLAQATGNLICNAVEHGGGDIEVCGRVGTGGVRIEILDRGPGLDAPIAELIRRSGAEHRHGHGLRVASRIVIEHGGRLTAAPSDRGARLVLELPLPKQT